MCTWAGTYTHIKTKCKHCGFHFSVVSIKCIVNLRTGKVWCTCTLPLYTGRRLSLFDSPWQGDRGAVGPNGQTGPGGLRVMPWMDMFPWHPHTLWHVPMTPTYPVSEYVPMAPTYPVSCSHDNHIPECVRICLLEYRAGAILFSMLNQALWAALHLNPESTDQHVMISWAVQDMFPCYVSCV